MTVTEIEAVFKRHSVRSYLDRRIDPGTGDSLRAVLSDCNRKSGLHLQYLPEAGNAFGRLLSRVMGLASAPSLIACVGKDGEDLEEKIGYYGERAVLAAQTLGLNTCWAGTFSGKNVLCDVGEGERLVIVIAVGYGRDQGRARRSKSADRVSSAKGERPAWFDRGVEMALLAPTAIDQQNFEFVLGEDGTVRSLDRGGPFSRVDLGIVRYHFDLARKEAGLDALWG